MITPKRNRFLILTLFCAAAFSCGETMAAAEPPAALKIVARKRLQGPSKWGIPAEFRLIRNFTELVRAVGLDEANETYFEFGRPKIDFQRYMLAYVSAGSQRSSGYAVKIVDAARRNVDGRPEIVVRWSLYEPQGYVLWVITTPAELVMVERADGEPTFQRIPFADKPVENGDHGGPSTGAGAVRENGADNAQKPPQPSVNWDELARESAALGLPQPPADARLAAKFYDMELVEERDLVVPLHAPRYLLGFVLTDAAGGKKFLVGSELLNLRADNDDLVDVAADKDLPSRIVESYEWGAFEIDVALPTAVECYRRGMKLVAEKLLNAQSSRSFEHPKSVFHQPAGLRPEVALHYVAWAHWGNQLAESATDRAAVHQRMNDLIRREPALQTPERKALFESLAAALKPSTAAPGTSERLIDDLVDVDALYFDRQPAVGTPAPLRELAKRGWEAMPALWNHLDDRRLTRSIVRPWDGSAAYIPQVGELASNLIQEFAGDEGRDWKRTPDGGLLVAGPVHEWRRRAQSLGEEKYLVENVLPRAPQSTRPYEAIVLRLAAKYPNRLPEVYRKLLTDRPDVGSWSIVSALVSAVDPALCGDVLAEGAVHANLSRQVEALEALSQIDAKRFEALLIGSLAKLPPKPSGRYADCEQADVARLCWKTERADVWTALRDAAARADAGVRLEIMESLGRKPEMRFDDRKRFADFLAAFLDDATVRDMTADSQKYDGCAGSWLPKLEVRNWAALQMAALFGLDDSNFRGRKPPGDDQWAALRKKVAQLRQNMP